MLGPKSEDTKSMETGKKSAKLEVQKATQPEPTQKEVLLIVKP
jgi:hypothetical protein